VNDLRVTVAARLLLVLCAIAAFSTVLALVVQDRSLARDLRKAAQVRLDRSASVAGNLLESHLQTLAARYRAISGTPEFRANLEVEHPPTLSYYARRLAALEGASLVLFLDREDEAIGIGGDQQLVALATRYLQSRRNTRCDLQHAPDSQLAFHAHAQLGMPGFIDCPPRGPGGEEALLLARDETPYALAVVPLHRDEHSLGRLLALEPIPDSILSSWSHVSGVELSIAPLASIPQTDFFRGVRQIGALEFRATGSLLAEHNALANSRRNLITAGLVALALAFLASFFLARELVRPIRAIEAATGRIAVGDLQSRLEMGRRDEFGDVARTFNDMLDQLETTQGRLASAQRLARLGNWGLEIDTGEIDYSEEFRRIYELDPDSEAIAVKVLSNRIHPGDRVRFEQVIRKCLRDGKPFRLDHRAIAQDGSERILHSQGERISRDGREVRLEGTVQDVTERKLVEDQVRHLAYHDSLTGLGNRLLFKERLALALREAKLEGHLVGLMFLDIDHFKVINDTLGHSAGDELLEHVSDRLITCVRLRDRITGLADSTVCRLGGDEFTILLTDVKDEAQITRVAERILQSLAHPFEIRGQEIAIGGSIGITIWPNDGEDVEALLRNSDTAMYHAKKKGRNNYQFYTESMKEAAYKRLKLENKLRRAIERDEFHVFYQPKLELESGRITGIEALARWRDPELGFVLPDDFIPLAEEIGSILAIGEWVLRTAARQNAEWIAAGLPPVRVSVNLSPHQIEDRSFVETVRHILEETGLDPAQLELEITESTLMDDEEVAVQLLRELKELGISLSLDDFGTGYSSLSYLRLLPIDTLKIDRSFVRRIANDEDDAALVGAIISMAKALRLRVVVEGVETEQQRDCLYELGCDEIQGFLFSVPLAANSAAALLKSHHEQLQAHPQQRERRRKKR